MRKREAGHRKNRTLEMLVRDSIKNIKQARKTIRKKHPGLFN